MDKLDKYFQPLNSPMAKRPVVATSFQFDSGNERNAVDRSKIRDIDISSVIVGTLIVGGMNNPVSIIINDSNNQQIAEIDENGIILLGTASLQAYHTSLGSIAFFGPDSGGTIHLQTAVTAPMEMNMGSSLLIQMGATGIGTTTLSGNLAVSKNISGSPSLTGGTVANTLLSGTATSLAGTLVSPIVQGTAVLDVNASTAALGVNGNFAIQTFGGSAVLTARVGGTNFRFISDGTF